MEYSIERRLYRKASVTLSIAGRLLKSLSMLGLFNGLEIAGKYEDIVFDTAVLFDFDFRAIFDSSLLLVIRFALIHY
jgi:hypothetical protein